MKAEQLTDVCTCHGEGPMWDEAAGVLRWVDMLNGDILTLTPAGDIDRLHVGAARSPARGDAR